MPQDVPLLSVNSVKSVVPLGPSAGLVTTRSQSSFASLKFNEFFVFHGGMVTTDEHEARRSVEALRRLGTNAVPYLIEEAFNTRVDPPM